MVDLPGGRAVGSSAAAPAPATAGPRSLSEARIWADLRRYYSDEGVNAWNDTVPYHVTSNPLIADLYAHIIVRFIGDVLATGRFDAAEPFYVIELGAGSGKFGFHLLRRLTQLRQDLGLTEVRVVHVMTDVATSNIEHWRHHPGLRPFVDAGLLAFGCLDVEVGTELRLVDDGGHSATEVAAVTNPPIVIANYLFDSVSQDFFNVSDGRLAEMLAEVVPVGDSKDLDASPRRLVWSSQPTSLPHYHDVDIDAVLAELVGASPNQSLLFPIAGLRFVKRLLGQSGNRLCLVASDLGVSDRGLIKDLELEVSSGFFYLPVELDVIGSLLLRFGPGLHTNARSSALDTSVSIVGFGPEELPETRHAFSAFVETFSVSGHKTVAWFLERAGAAMSVEDWLSIAALLRYDSRLLDASVDLAPRWARLGPISPRVRSQLLRTFERITSSCYWLPGAPDTYFNIGLILHELGEYAEAVEAFTASLAMVGEAPETFFNLGLCLQVLGRDSDAFASFARAVELNPRHIRARGWMAQLNFERAAGEQPGPAPSPVPEVSDAGVSDSGVPDSGVAGAGVSDSGVAGADVSDADVSSQRFVPLSQAPVWDGVREFYEAKGVSAWDGKVPLHITSNSLIADSYAQVIVRFIGDVQASGRFDPDEPFYVVELGAGPGKFGFHLVRRLTELAGDLGGLGGARIVYLMTDAIPANIDYWLHQKRLRPFVDAGLLAFGRFDMTTDESVLVLAADGTGAEVASFVNPPVVVSNYVIDSLPQDLFTVTDGQLEMMMVSVIPAEGGLSEPHPPVARPAGSRRPVALPLYGDAEVDGFLADLVPHIEGKKLVFPVVALRCLRRLAVASAGRLCLLASDLGPSETPMEDLNLEMSDEYFYLPVDLDVVGEYLALLVRPGGLGQGWLHRISRSPTLDTSLSVIGFDPAELRETEQAFRSGVGSFGPGGQRTIRAMLARVGPALTADDWLALAAMHRYDSDLLDGTVGLLTSLASSGALTARQRGELLNALAHIAEDSYFLPGAPDTLFNIGVILHEMGEVDAAIVLFNMSLEFAGDSPETLFSLGLCLQSAGRYLEALDSFQRVVALNPKHILARGWIAQIEFDLADPGRMADTADA